MEMEAGLTHAAVAMRQKMIDDVDRMKDEIEKLYKAI